MHYEKMRNEQEQWKHEQSFDRDLQQLWDEDYHEMLWHESQKGEEL